MNVRDKAIDLLRIIAMFCVIIGHCIVNGFGLQEILVGGGITQIVDSKLSTCVEIFFYSFAIIGVDLFFLLSGWCRIHLKAVKVIDMILKVYVLFFIIQTVGILTGFVDFDKSAIRHILDPFDYYWYLITYLLLMLASPFLNKVIDAFDKNLFIYYAVFFVVVLCVYGFVIDGVLHINKGYSFIMACGLYILGGGLRKEKNSILNDKRKSKYLLTFILSGFILFVVSGALYYLGFLDLTWKMFSYNNPLMVVEAVSLILFITGTRPSIDENNIALKVFPRTTITTYLCHSTCWLATVRNIVVVYLITKLGFVFALILLPFFAFLIYAICSVIDMLYEKTIGRSTHVAFESICKRFI